jgi:hypothetical protein
MLFEDFNYNQFNKYIILMDPEMILEEQEKI